MQGYFSVITEIFDDSGRPHTLEHLVFMGSEQYPYKGILDSIANRSFANGSESATRLTCSVALQGAQLHPRRGRDGRARAEVLTPPSL